MNKTTYIILALVLVILVGCPLLFLPDADYEGADGQAEEVIGEINPTYEPWFEPLWEPPSGEIESLLFALQAALGSGLIGYFLGRSVHRAKTHSSKS